MAGLFFLRCPGESGPFCFLSAFRTKGPDRTSRCSVRSRSHGVIRHNAEQKIGIPQVGKAQRKEGPSPSHNAGVSAKGPGQGSPSVSSGRPRNRKVHRSRGPARPVGVTAGHARSPVNVLMGPPAVLDFVGLSTQFDHPDEAEADGDGFHLRSVSRCMWPFVRPKAHGHMDG